VLFCGFDIIVCGSKKYQKEEQDAKKN